MKIVLLRHGKPDLSEYGKLRANEIHLWISSYNSTGLAPESTPLREAFKIANACNTVVCSDLLRSIESAQAFEVKQIDIIDPIFKEMGLPYGNFPFLKMHPNRWAAFFRVLWFFGYSSNSESLREAKLRAENGAKKLKEAAALSGSVLLVGHGFVNRFIAKELLASDWKGPKNPGKEYWEFGVYEYAT